LPNFICRNRHGTYYFRFIIPIAFRAHFSNKHEYRHSLQTDSKKLAVRHAKIYRARFDLLLEKFYSMPNTNKTGLIRSTDIFGDLIEADFNGDVEKELHATERMKEQSIDRAIKMGIDPASLLTSRQTQPSARTNEPISAETPTVSEISKKYLEYKKTRSKLAQKTIDAYSSDHDLLIFILGEDKPVGELTNDDLEAFYSGLGKIPTSYRSDEKYKYKSFRQLRDIHIPKERFPDVVTINKKFSRVSTLLNHAVNKNYISRNPANSVMVTKDTVRAKDKREILSHNDLDTIFASSFYTAHQWRKNLHRRDAEPYRFWMFPLALLTGARQGELLQLKKKDVAQSEDGTWYIDIREEFDKVTGEKTRSTKNQNSIRQVPLSDSLIEMGFLDFVKSVRSNALFSELTKKLNGQDAAQKFLNAQLKRWGVHVTDVKTFHSFRHTFVTQAIRQDIKPQHIGAITGHLNKEEYKDVAEIANTYNKGLTIADLKKKVLDVIDYGLDLDAIRW
jgi:integrase